MPALSSMLSLINLRTQRCPEINVGQFIAPPGIVGFDKFLRIWNQTSGARMADFPGCARIEGRYGDV
jgi:hypothetical protein